MVEADRHPSGQVVRKTEAQRIKETMAVVVNARMLHHDLTEAQAKKGDAGTVLGRLLITGEISYRQHEAGKLYADFAADGRRALGVNGIPSGSDIQRVRSYDGSDGSDAEYIKRCRAAIERYQRCRRVLLTAGQFASMVVDAVVCDDVPMPDHVGDLREGLNALAQEWGLPHWDVDDGEQNGNTRDYINSF